MSLEIVLREPLGLPIGFPLVPFLNGIVFYYIIENMLFCFNFVVAGLQPPHFSLYYGKLLN